MIKLLTDKQIQTCQESFPHSFFSLYSVDLNHIKEEVSDHQKISANNYLSSPEMDRFLSFKYPKRQLEWFGGRLAAKNAIIFLLKGAVSFPSLHQISIEPSATGRPFLNSPVEHPPVDISISHSDNLAVAIAAKNSFCGIDIQKITPTISKVKSRFATLKEERILQKIKTDFHCAEEVSLGMLWAAKEAFRKRHVCQPLLGFLDVSLESFQGSLEGGLTGLFSCSRPEYIDQQLKAFFTLTGTYAVAISL